MKPATTIDNTYYFLININVIKTTMHIIIYTIPIILNSYSLI